MYTIQENVANHFFEQWKKRSPELGPQPVMGCQSSTVVHRCKHSPENFLFSGVHLWGAVFYQIWREATCHLLAQYLQLL